MKREVIVVYVAYNVSHIHTLCGTLSISASKGNNSFINLNARNDSFVLENFDKWSAVLCLLVECLVEENNPADVFSNRGISRKQ